MQYVLFTDNLADLSVREACRGAKRAGFDGLDLTLRPGGSGDVTDTHVAWRQTRGLPYLASPLHYRGRVYLAKDGGILSCFDARTGRPHFRERLDVRGDYYASPVAGDGKIYVPAKPGTIITVRAADTLEILARNEFGQPITATPAIVDGQLYVRTESHLYAFGK